MEKFHNFETEVSEIPEVKSGLVSLLFSHNQSHVCLEAIWSEVERKKGHASSAMKAVLDLADKYEIDIFGHPHALRYDTDFHEQAGTFSEDLLDRWDQLNEQAMTNEQLLEWYHRLGFELTGNTSGDDPEIVRRANSHQPGWRAY
jgi:hypothetical protein